MIRTDAPDNAGAGALDEKDDKHSIQVVSRALSVLRALGRSPGGLSLAEIANETDLPRSTVQRLVGALEVEGFVESMGASGGSRLGSAVLQLVHSAHGDILSIARPRMQALSNAVNETVVLSSVNGRQAVMIDRIVAERELCVMLPIGVAQNPWTTSNGKALLAILPDELVLKLLSEDSTAPRSIASAKGRAAFLRELTEIRQTGLAYDREKTHAGICSVGAALDTYLGSYGIAIVTPANRFEANLRHMSDQILEFKRSVEALLGEKKRKMHSRLR